VETGLRPLQPEPAIRIRVCLRAYRQPLEDGLGFSRAATFPKGHGFSRAVRTHANQRLPHSSSFVVQSRDMVYILSRNILYSSVGGTELGIQRSTIEQSWHASIGETIPITLID
jgi:hypothetical protein